MTQQGDLELLRRFEPIVRYTLGEYFFPMAVDPYLAECDLWAESPDGERTMLAARGELSVENLASWKPRVPESTLFLRYVQEPLSGFELARGGRPPRERFRAASRLARVGILARLIDAGFDLSLLVRGSVPGGTVAAAEMKYAQVRAGDHVPRYHGRVVRQGGWTVCQYLFFYAMNPWRTSFSGANDHEADWEQCFVFLDTKPDGSVVPVWFARAAHDEVGADLRRRWDDPMLLREGDHPIIFAGAGSHAAYIEAGEYLQEVPLRLPPVIARVAGAVRQFWTGILRQGSARRPTGERFAAVAFVDYARGDGLSIGPGQEETWEPILIDDGTPWVAGYDGLFGLDTRDRFAGERAPAGPKFNRDGRPRQSWIDPVGFAGLHGESPPSQRTAVLEAEVEKLAVELAGVEEGIGARQGEAQQLGLRVAASIRAGRSEAILAPVEAARDDAIGELSNLRRRADDLRVTIADTAAELDRARGGDFGDPRQHLHFVARPQDPGDINLSRLLDIWSAFSIALAILILGVLLILQVPHLWIAVLIVIVGYAAIEALVRRRLLRFLLNVTVVLAVIGSLILLVTYWLEAIALFVIAIGFLILRDNFGELRASLRR
jgi:hypothetical protein